MKAITFGLITLAFFVLTTTAAMADDRGGRYHSVRGGDGWRLGERVRGGFAIYHRGYRVPGAAISIADGWVLGTKRESGGYAIYRWNGRDWDQAPGGAVEIGGSYNNPWVVNNRGQRYSWNGYDWEPGFRAKRIDRGRDSHDRHDYGWSAFGRHFERNDRNRYSSRYDRDRHDHNRSDRRRTRW